TRSKRDWSSDVCSSDLADGRCGAPPQRGRLADDRCPPRGTHRPRGRHGAGHLPAGREPTAAGGTVGGGPRSRAPGGGSAPRDGPRRGRMTSMHTLWTVLIVIAALALAGGAGAPLTAGILRWADRRRDRDQEEGREQVDAGEILRGGLWIGILERLAVAGCILLAYPAGIAVVVAIKGLGRFSTLRDEPSAGVSERFLVGTLTSYLWAAAVAVAAVGALGAIP